MNIIRFGIIGCGHFGAEMARMIHAEEGMSLTAVYSINHEGAARVKEELGCDTEDTLESLLSRKDIDAVLIASPNVYHPEQAIASASAKKHIFCEKPLAFTVRDAQTVIDSADRNRVVLMTGFTMRFYDGFIRMKRMVDKGVIGKPLSAYASRVGWDEPAQTKSWKKDMLISGGHLYHHIHEIDLLLWLMGGISSVYATGGNMIHNDLGMGTQDDLLLLSFQFENGGLGAMESSSLHRIPEHCVKINGTTGGMLADMRESTLTLIHDGKKEVVCPMFSDPESQAFNITYNQLGPTHGAPTNRPPLTFQTTMPAELRMFCQKLRGKDIDFIYQDMFGGEAAKRASAVVEAALRSQKMHAPVKVD